MPLTSKSKKKFTFKIGADPEFLILLYENRLSAKEIITKTFDNILQPVDMGFHCKYGDIGWDGSNATGELRPNPSLTPSRLTSNIRGIMNEFGKQVKILELVTLSKGAPVGGHIHLELIRNSKCTFKDEEKQRILMSYYWPMIMSENKINVYNRVRTGYGKVADFRVGEKTFEFRTPSAEWMTTPKLSSAIFSYLGVIWHEIHHNPKNINNTLLHATDEQAQALQNLAVSDFKAITKYIITQVSKSIRTFELYPIFKKEIDYILNYKKVIDDKEKVDYEILQGWKIVDRKNLTKKEVMKSSTSGVDKIPINSDQMFNFMKFPYNKDIKVALFVEELTLRILINNWKLKNNYYFYGTRKGVKHWIINNTNLEILEGKENIEKENDITTMRNLIDRMANKFNIGVKQFGQDKNKENREKDRKHIMIGIPYDVRIKNKYNEFIKRIWDLEKGKLIPIKLETLHRDITNTDHKRDITSGLDVAYNLNNIKVPGANRVTPKIKKKPRTMQQVAREQATQSLENDLQFKLNPNGFVAADIMSTN